MSVELCKTLAETLPDDELAACWRILYNEHQKRSEGIAAKNKASLCSGDKVQWTTSRGTVTGVVDRVKRKKALVWQDLNGQPDRSQRWDIPLGMLVKLS
jgi:hypothetical protein